MVFDGEAAIGLLQFLFGGARAGRPASRSSRVCYSIYCSWSQSLSVSGFRFRSLRLQPGSRDNRSQKLENSIIANSMTLLTTGLPLLRLLASAPVASPVGRNIASVIIRAAFSSCFERGAHFGCVLGDGRLARAFERTRGRTPDRPASSIHPNSLNDRMVFCSRPSSRLRAMMTSFIRRSFSALRLASSIRSYISRRRKPRRRRDPHRLLRAPSSCRAPKPRRCRPRQPRR